jgi:filamentous hemagglutinin family protein
MRFQPEASRSASVRHDELSSLPKPETEPSCLSGVILSALLLLWNSVVGLGGVAYSQVTSPIASSGLNTQISAPINLPAGKVQYDITGGTRPGGGENLFHSFGEFGVPTNNIANFFNGASFDLAGNPLAPGLPTSNILSRVTGGNISNIFGAIQTEGFGNANLFLMNPAGFLFGPNATLNVGGMVAFTSADYLKLSDSVKFNANPNAAAEALLTASPVVAFGFLGSNPSAITIQGSQFTVTEGAGISLVGGNIAIQSGTLEDATAQPARLSAPGGQINLASGASPGEVLTSNFDSGANMTLGSITLSEGSVLDVSANAAGTVRIRSGAFVMDNATVSADTVNADGVTVAVDIQVTADLSMSTNLNPAITARTSGSGNAGEVRIKSANLTAASNAQDFTLALIDTHTSGTGKAGNVLITTGDLQPTGSPLPFWFIDSGTQGPGNGGDVTITARNIFLHQTEISTGDLRARNLPIEQDVTGSGGNIKITADSLDMTVATIHSDAFGGHGGDITLEVGDIQMKQGSQMGVSGLEGSGAFTVNADRFVMDNQGLIEADTAFVSGRPVTITANSVELKNGSAIRSHALGNADAGDIIVTASDHVTLSDGPFTGRPSGFYSSSVGFEDVELDALGGNAGSIRITTPRLEMSGGARIDTSSQTNGRGGDVTITAGSISVIGERTLPIPEDDFDIADSRSSGIFSRSVGSEFCSGPCGDAGHISISTGSLTLDSGGVIDTTTSSTGQGGVISIHATNGISMSGTLREGTPGGIFSSTVGTAPDSGDGGNIALAAGQLVNLTDGASVSASSTGPGNTGNIQIDAGNQFAMTNSSVTTQANLASGGTIKITTTPSGTVQLTNSLISASVLDGTGGGGSVNIDPQFVILQNSQILARAVEGPGGNISITTNLLLQDANSVISASSGNPAFNGTVTIQSPNAPASGKIQPLGKTPLQATSLLNQHCASLAGGEFSSFNVAGRDSLPTEPSSWLTSPLALATLSAGTGIAGRDEGLEGITLGASTVNETALLSLRQIAPPGFLTQTFAVDWSASCQS